MIDIFSSDSNYSLKSEMPHLPAKFNGTDIDYMIRGKREMVAIELKNIKVIPDNFEVSAPQYYTYKFLSLKGIPSFYVFKRDDMCLVWYVGKHAEPRYKEGKLVLPVKEMGRHKSLNDAIDIMCKMLTAEEAYNREEVAALVGKLVNRKVAGDKA